MKSNRISSIMEKGQIKILFDNNGQSYIIAAVINGKTEIYERILRSGMVASDFLDFVKVLRYAIVLSTPKKQSPLFEAILTVFEGEEKAYHIVCTTEKTMCYLRGEVIVQIARPYVNGFAALIPIGAIIDYEIKRVVIKDGELYAKFETELLNHIKDRHF